MNTIVQHFHTKFNVLNHKGLLGLVGLDDNLIKLKDYCKNLYTIVVDKSKFVGSKGHIIVKEFLKYL